jgi:hypothetical protein
MGVQEGAPRPIRLTVDLNPAMHRGLSRLAAEVAADMGRPGVPLVTVMRSMITATLEDEQVWAAVQTRLPRKKRRRSW